MATDDTATAAALLALYNDARSAAMSEAEFSQRMGVIIGDSIRRAVANLISLEATDSMGGAVTLISGESEVL